MENLFFSFLKAQCKLIKLHRVAPSWNDFDASRYVCMIIRIDAEACWHMLTYVPCWNPSRSTTKLCATCQATRRRLFSDPPRLWCKGTQGRAWTWWHLVAFGGYSDLQCSSSILFPLWRQGWIRLGKAWNSMPLELHFRRLCETTSACWMPAAYCPSPHCFRNPNCSFSILYNMIAQYCSSILRNQTNEDDWPAGFCFQIYLQMDLQNLALRPSSVEMLTPATGTGRSSLSLGDDSWRAAHLIFTTPFASHVSISLEQWHASIVAWALPPGAPKRGSSSEYAASLVGRIIHFASADTERIRKVNWVSVKV